MHDSDFASDEFAVTPYINEIETVARRGHKDPSTENLLLAFLELHQEQVEVVEKFVSFFIRRATEQRLEFTSRAFRLSLLTAVKLYVRIRDVRDYEFFSVQRWKHVLEQCLTGPDEEFVQYCLRDVSTVKIYRYVALQIIGGILTSSYHTFDSGLRILDGGCSLNIGIKCLNDLDIFKRVEIAPEILKASGGDTLHTFSIKYARGIDKYLPSLERTLASLFPSEVKIWEDLYIKLYYLRKEKIYYQQQDILYLDRRDEYKNAFDLVFLSSLLRRFPAHLIADVLVQVNYATRHRSFLVINEQVSADTIEGGGNYATFILPKYILERLVQQTRKVADLYELLNIAFQLLWYPDENCEKVFPGKDFEAFLQLCTSQRSSFANSRG
jgi:hypothetical protein